MVNRAQRISLIALIGAGALAVSGCSYINPQSTGQIYSPSDGVRTDMGSLQLRNILIVSSGENKPGRVIGAVFNTSDSDIELTISGPAGSQTEVAVKAHGDYYLTEKSNSSILSSVGAAPGAMEMLTLEQSGSTGPQTAQLNVPVLDGTLEEYQKYIPTPGAESTSDSSASSTSSSSSTSTSSSTSSATATSGS
ncbi:hypothetical protein IV500_20125 [Paeniglutamicibacter antarcticus]|uniref:Lipoprotein n=1 Tax=Arthrobacter terrae TaxID=2935737 RepID=A0A931G7E4_9MICC|nr:hypothetical protein [Arthrobacter terrae]